MIISNKKHIVTSKKVWKKIVVQIYVTFWSLGFIDVLSVLSQNITKLSVKLLVQVQFFKYSCNPHFLLHSQAHILGFQE